MWCWGKMENIKWSEKVTNEEVLDHIGERTLLNNILSRKVNWIVHILRRNCLHHEVIERQMTEGKGVGKRRTLLLDDLRSTRRYCDLQEEAEDWKRWKQQFINRAKGRNTCFPVFLRFFYYSIVLYLVLGFLTDFKDANSSLSDMFFLAVFWRPSAELMSMVWRVFISPSGFIPHVSVISSNCCKTNTMCKKVESFSKASKKHGK